MVIRISTSTVLIYLVYLHLKPGAFPKIIRLSNRNYKFIKFDTKQKTPYKDKTDLKMNLIKENDRDIYWLVNQKNVKEVEHCILYL